MTTRQLKDSNWASARRSIMAKYNKTGDGHYDEKEVEGIIDDYMGTIYNHQTLETKNESQKKMIIFGAIMIVLLTLSNLGTGIAAAFIAKDTQVVDGKLQGTGDDDGDGFAIATETSIRTFEIKVNKLWGGPDAFRRMQEVDGTEEVDETETMACIDQVTSKRVFDAVTQRGTAKIYLLNSDGDEPEKGGSMAGKMFTSTKGMNAFGVSARVHSVVQLKGNVRFRQITGKNSVLQFSDSKVEIDPNDAMCNAEGRFALKMMTSAF